MKILRPTVLALILVFSAQSHSQVLINEFMAANTSTIQDEFGGYPDWIELKNLTDLPVNIGGWYITDSIPDLTKFMIKVTQPDSTTIPANGYLLFWADSKKSQGVRHVDFKLSKSGEQIALSRMINGILTIVDSVTFKEQISDLSYGRERGTNRWIYMNQPTPGAPNLPLSVTSLTNSNGFKVWPNPTNGLAMLKGEMSGDVKIHLFNILGEEVESLNAPGSELHSGYSINLQGRTPGLYQIVLQAKDRTSRLSLLLQ